MSSRAWDHRRWRQRQRLARRPLVKALRSTGVRWPPAVGQVVCDCRFQHRRVVRVDARSGDVVLDDGYSCDIDHCIGPADHNVSTHPRATQA